MEHINVQKQTRFKCGHLQLGCSELWMPDKPLVDLDANSLYPTSMVDNPIVNSLLTPDNPNPIEQWTAEHGTWKNLLEDPNIYAIIKLDKVLPPIQPKCFSVVPVRPINIPKNKGIPSAILWYGGSIFNYWTDTIMLKEMVLENWDIGNIIEGIIFKGRTESLAKFQYSFYQWRADVKNK